MRWINFYRSVLPICLVAGRAAAAAGYYLFALLLPALLNQSYLARRKAFGIGLSLVCAYLSFPFIDGVHLLLGVPSEEFGGESLSFAFKSQFSSAVGITGLFFCVYGFFLSRHALPMQEDTDVAKDFTFGFLVAGVLLAGYALVQLFTGFNFSDIADQRTDRIMAYGLYRVPGFTGHPVHFAGQCLPVFAFFWARCWLAAPRLRYQEICLSILFFVMIWLSGSRMGALVAMILLILTPWLLGSFTWRERSYIAAIGAALGVILTYVTGMIGRVIEVFGQGELAGLGNRLTFWKVHTQMFIDSPWVGWGHIWTEAYWREMYYQKLGYANFPEQYNAHNVYLEILANGGIIGFSVVVISLFSLSYQLSKTLAPSLSVPLLFAFCSLGLFGLTQNSFFDTPAQLILLGLMVTCLWAQRPELVES